MIRCDLEVTRGGFRAGLQLETDAQVSGLFGPSGSGKSTLLAAIAGLVPGARGRLEVGGCTLLDSAHGVDLSPEARRVAMVFQDARLFPHRTVRGNLTVSPRLRRYPGPTLDEVTALLGIGDLLDRLPGTLSGGEQRRVAIGRALLARPRLLLLDEPLAGLDAPLARRVLAYLLRLKQTLELNFLYVSHGLSDFLALVDEAVVLDRGTVVQRGAPGTWLEHALSLPGAGPLATTLEGTVTAVREGTAQVTVSGTAFSLVLVDAHIGDPVYLTVPARDVLLAVGEPPRTSARNRLAGTVVAVTGEGPQRRVELDVGPRIWAEVTPEAGRELDLAPGRAVHALIKSSALRGTTLRTAGAPVRTPSD